MLRGFQTLVLFMATDPLNFDYNMCKNTATKNAILTLSDMIRLLKGVQYML